MSTHTQPLHNSSFEEPLLTTKINQLLKFIRGYSAQFPPPHTHVLLLLSGGLDSSLLWLLLAKKYQLQVHPFHLHPSQTARAQTQSIHRLLPFFRSTLGKLYHSPIFIPFDLPQPPSTSNLTPPHLETWAQANLTFNSKTNQLKLFPISNPTRFFHYTALAIHYAHQLRLTHSYNLTHIFFGLVPDDTTLNRESTLTTLRSLTLTTCIIFGDPDWQLLTPLDKSLNFYYPKAKLIQYGAKFNFPFQHTWSCDYNGRYQCGLCYNCKGRKLAFDQAKVPDPTIYRPNFRSLKDKLREKILSLKALSHP